MSIPGFDDQRKSPWDDWLQTPQGKYILEWEQARFDQMVADIFGFNAVQIGLPQCDCLRANRMPLRFVYFVYDATGPAGVRGDAHHLPLAGNSVDLVVLPHVLEFSPDPHQILREVERVLVPEGQVLISGFNPISLWGIKRRLAGRRAAFPWQGQYFSVRRLKDLLTLLSFETQAGCFGRYSPAVTQEKWLRRWHFLELAGDRWWPIAGAVYLLQGVKRQHGLRLLTPAWHDRKARAKALAPAVQKTKLSGVSVQANVRVSGRYAETRIQKDGQ